MTEPGSELLYSENRRQRRLKRKLSAGDTPRNNAASAGRHGQDLRTYAARLSEELTELQRELIPNPPPARPQKQTCEVPDADRTVRCKHGHHLLPDEPCGESLLDESPTLQVRKAYRLLDRLRPISNNRTARCRRFRLNKDVQVMSDGESAWVTGVNSCNNVWGCPVCASAIQRERADLIDYAIDHWIGYTDRKGPSNARAYLLTTTIRHAISHKLKKTSQLVADAWTLFFAGRNGQLARKRLGVCHFVRALEPTYGEAGWHPHLHIILMTDKELTDEDQKFIQNHWHDCVMAAGFDADGYHREFAPNDKHGIKLRELYVARDGRYVSKMFLELTSYQTKEGHKDGQMTWWQIAEAAATGIQGMVRVWQDAQRAMFGRRQLTWSKGTADFFGLGDLVDEDINHPDGVKVTDVREVFRLQIPGKVWDEAWRRDRLFLSILLPSVIRATQTGDWSALLALLSAELSRVGGGESPTRPFDAYCS